jgi:rSAM/selenodomain-associated transferase 2
MTVAPANIGEVSRPLISIIIPALDESETLGAAMAAAHASTIAFELIVVDGGSSDKTVAIAEAAGANVIASSCRQRAHQLNLGARRAQGEILLFLHADTFLPRGALEKVVAALQTRAIAGGAFARRYASRSFLLNFTCRLALWRNRLIGWHLGDQAMFVRRHIFHQLGGFREVDVFEDLNFSRRLKRLGKVITLEPGVTSSARRFHRHGAALTTLRDVALTIRYLIRGLPAPAPRGEVHPVSVC